MSNHKIGINKRYWIKLFLFFLVCLLLGWFFIILGLSGRYIDKMLNPGCAPAPPPPEGFATVSIPFEDQFLTGWWYPPQNGAVILLLGGHGSNQAAMQTEAEFLSKAGYGVLTTNYRHCLNQQVSFGRLELAEFEAAYDYVQVKVPHASYGVVGFSAGSVTGIRGTAAHPEIKALVGIGNYANLANEIHNRQAPNGIFQRQMEQGVYFWYWVRTGLSPKDVNCFPVLETIQPRPVLLIHGANEAENNQAAEQKQAAGENASLWIVPGSSHGSYYEMAPEQYPKIMINFLDQHLLPKE